MDLSKFGLLDRVRVGAKSAVHAMKFGAQGRVVKWHGLIDVDPVELAREIKNGWPRDGIDGWIAKQLGAGRMLLLPNPNLVVNSGVNISLDRLFALPTAGTMPAAVATMGVDDGTANPVAATSSSTAGSTNRRLIAFDAPGATRSGQIVTAVGTFTQANVAFVMKRLFLSKAAAGVADAVGDLYAMTNVFTIDMTGFTTWSQAFTAEVTGSGS